MRVYTCIAGDFHQALRFHLQLRLHTQKSGRTNQTTKFNKLYNSIQYTKIMVGSIEIPHFASHFSQYKVFTPCRNIFMQETDRVCTISCPSCGHFIIVSRTYRPVGSCRNVVLCCSHRC